MKENDSDSWAQLTPAALFAHTSAGGQAAGVTEAWKALCYGRRDSNVYDTIAHRIAAATTCRGEVPLQSLAGVRHRRSLESPSRESRRLLHEQAQMRPRALDVPSKNESLRFQGTEDVCEFFVAKESSAGARFAERWLVSLRTPPKILLDHAVARDAPRTLNQQFRFSLPGARWFPLSALISAGRIHRYQNWCDELVADIGPGRLYLFVSHRWRSPKDPDPDGSEASLLAWQLIDHLREAILIADRRGLHTPRMYNPNFNCYVGLAARELSEALIVNLLRPGFDDAGFCALVEETNSLEEELEGDALATAQSDRGLERLRRVLISRPHLATACERICVWYDFGCVPQLPRNRAEQALVEEVLRRLTQIQMVGRTIVLLDEPEEYLARAWCTLEAFSAGAELDLIHTTRRSAIADDEVAAYFGDLLKDRPHIVRRALLDTLLFGKQTPEECFNRLGVAVGQRTDLPLVFDALVRASPPSAFHSDSSAVVTGTLPLPRRADGRVVLPNNGRLLEEIPDAEHATLYWLRSCELNADAIPSEVPASHMDLLPKSGGANQPTAHVFVIASCEGDAALLAAWTRAHIDELERASGTDVFAITWLSEDVAPVGYMPCGALQVVVMDASTLIIVGPQTAIHGSAVVGNLLTAAAAAEKQRFVLFADSCEGNLRRLSQPQKIASEALTIVAVSELIPAPIPGGVFVAALGESDTLLRPRPAPAAVDPIDLEPPPVDLQVLLIQSLWSNDFQRTAVLCHSYPQSICEGFRSWSRVPDELRTSNDATNAYMQAVFRLANIMDSFGFPRPLEQLTAQDNPIARLRKLYAKAAALSERSYYRESSGLLTQCLEELAPLKGSFVANLLPKALGLLGRNWFRAGDLDQARTFTEQALEACVESGDLEGVEIYRANLQVLDRSQAGGDFAPIAEILHAQSLSDQGRFELSNRVLEAHDGGDEYWVAKVRGLMGLNYYWLGNFDAARRFTREAIQVSDAVGDIEGARVYRANLQLLGS